MTPGRPSGDSKDPEGLLDVLARLVAEGSEWAAGVERWRQDNPGRALTEPQRRRLREVRDRVWPRPKLTAADEADALAIVEAYVASQRRVIKDPGFVALSAHHADAKAILPDARLLAARAARGDWKPTPAEVVARRLETYLRDPRNGPAFALRWVLDRTEQDDLPRPPAVAPSAKAREDPIGARRGPVLKPTPPPPDVAAKVAEFTKKPTRT